MPFDNLPSRQTPLSPDGWKKVHEHGQGGAVTHRVVWRRENVGYCGLAGEPWNYREE